RPERDRHDETIFGRRSRLAGAVEIGEQVVREVVSDAVRDGRDFDRAQVLDQTGVRRLAVKGLETARQPGGEREGAGAAKNSRPDCNQVRPSPLPRLLPPCGGGRERGRAMPISLASATPTIVLFRPRD